MKNSWSVFAVVFACVAFGIGCSGGSDEGEDTPDGGGASGEGTAPVISDITFSPDKAVVGTQVTITGSVKFTDPDGDVDSLHVEIKLPGGSSQSIPSVQVQGAGGVTQSQAAFAIILLPPAAGEYVLSVWLADAAGSASNKLEATVTAE